MPSNGTSTTIRKQSERIAAMEKHLDRMKENAEKPPPHPFVYFLNTLDWTKVLLAAGLIGTNGGQALLNQSTTQAKVNEGQAAVQKAWQKTNIELRAENAILLRTLAICYDSEDRP